MVSAIPDRWKDYKPIGKKIEGTRFIAFKVPLKEHVSKNVDNKISLDGRKLLNKIPNLGLIIDLTNTHRYYDPKIFKEEGVEHKKLMIPGHETPCIDLTKKFIMIVEEFIENNKDNGKLIGVHCTHGVNRTGYMICKYMVSQLAMDPNDAIDKFADARGHKIERKNYIDDLCKPQETNRQHSSTNILVEPENWRERRVHNVQPENWRQGKQDNSQNKNDYKDNSGRQIPNNRSKRKYNPYRKNSPSSRANQSSSYSRSRLPISDSHSNARSSYARPTGHIADRPHYTMQSAMPSEERLRIPHRNDNVSYARPTDRMVERPHYTLPPSLPSEEQLRIPYQFPYQPSSLRCDYYNKRPVTGSQRNSRSRYTYNRRVED